MSRDYRLQLRSWAGVTALLYAAAAVAACVADQTAWAGLYGSLTGATGVLWWGLRP